MHYRLHLVPYKSLVSEVKYWMIKNSSLFLTLGPLSAFNNENDILRPFYDAITNRLAVGIHDWHIVALAEAYDELIDVLVDPNDLEHNMKYNVLVRREAYLNNLLETPFVKNTVRMLSVYNTDLERMFMLKMLHARLVSKYMPDDIIKYTRKNESTSISEMRIDFTLAQYEDQREFIDQCKNIPDSAIEELLNEYPNLNEPVTYDVNRYL